MKLTEQVAKIGQRVGALETKGFEDNGGIARIVKVYGNIRITATVRTTLHNYRKCLDINPLYGAVCGLDTYI